MAKNSKQIKYNRIKIELIEAGKHNIDLARHMGVLPNTVSDWCTNTNQPSIQDLYRISEYLRIDVRRLLISTKWENDTVTLAAETDSPPITKLFHKKLLAKSKRKSKSSK